MPATMRQVVLLLACLSATISIATSSPPNDNRILATSIPFHKWASEDSVLDGLNPSAYDLSADAFLELVASTSAEPEAGSDNDVDPLDMFANLDAQDPETAQVDPRADGGKKCSPEFDCSQFKEPSTASGSKEDRTQYYKPEANKPDVAFPVGKVPRQARCYLTCSYQSAYAFNDPNSGGDADAQAALGGDQAAAKRLARAATSFVETEQVEPDYIGSPFHCKTKCDFKEALYCNPVRRLMIGASGYTPEEHSCCETCEKICRGKTILDRYRLCNVGCRAYCPFVDVDALKAYVE